MKHIFRNCFENILQKYFSLCNDDLGNSARREVAATEKQFFDDSDYEYGYDYLYGERYDWLKTVFKNWCFQFMTTFLYYTDLEEYGEDAVKREAYKLGLAVFSGNAPTYHIELRDHPVLVWDFHSLLLAIQMLFTLMVTDETMPLRMCRNCQKAFFAKRKDSVFCSAGCRKKYNEK